MKYLLLAIFAVFALSCKSTHNNELSDIKEYKDSKYPVIVAAKGDVTFKDHPAPGQTRLGLGIPGWWDKKVTVVDAVKANDEIISVYSVNAKFELLVLCEATPNITEDPLTVVFSLYEEIGNRYSYASEVDNDVQVDCIESAVEAEPRLKKVFEDHGVTYGLSQGRFEVGDNHEPIGWDNSINSICNRPTFNDATKMVQHCQRLNRSCEQCLSMCAGERLTPGTKKRCV